MAKPRAYYDLAIIGGGIIGLATARQASIRHPKLRICVLEKEKELATHQSKRNSGVVHCGIYYKKGSMKSKFCIKGANLVKQYCQSKDLPYINCGKLIVATKKEELDALHNLFENATANRIAGIELFNAEQVQRVQPQCTNALEAIWSPNTAVVDWQKVAHSYAEDFKRNGGHVVTNFTSYRLLPANKGLLHVCDAKTDEFIEAKSVVNCAGVFSEYFSRITGNNEHPKVVPFRGSYYVLDDRLAKTIRTNVYPVPDPRYPFLGVHFTPRVDGSVLIGPTALLSLSYEKYQAEDSVNLFHMYHILFRSGVRKLLLKKDFWVAAYKEVMRLSDKERFAREASELIPGLKAEDLIDTKFCGIRAQVIEKDGRFVDDFLFETGVFPQYNRVLHVRNCPSPAATSSLAIAERVVNILEERLI